MSMREKLADLLARQNGYTSLLAMPAVQRDNWRDRADAVLDALMEPTEGMAEAGEVVDMLGEGHTADLVDAYRAMIHAARII